MSSYLVLWQYRIKLPAFFCHAIFSFPFSFLFLSTLPYYNILTYYYYHCCYYYLLLLPYRALNLIVSVLMMGLRCTGAGAGAGAALLQCSSGYCSASSSFHHVEGSASTCTYFDCTKSHHSPPNHPRHGRVTFIIVGTLWEASDGLSEVDTA